MQVTLLFQGFSEDGVLTRWFLGKFASGSCLAMENQTELVQERAESWAPEIRAPGLQWPVLLGSVLWEHLQADESSRTNIGVQPFPSAVEQGHSPIPVLGSLR